MVGKTNVLEQHSNQKVIVFEAVSSGRKVVVVGAIIGEIMLFTLQEQVDAVGVDGCHC